MNGKMIVEIRRTLGGISVSYQNKMGKVTYMNGDVDSAVNGVISLGFEPEFDVGLFVPKSITKRLESYGV
jgi:hypothetical protein